MIKLIDIINNTRILYNRPLIIEDDPGGGGGGTGGGTGNQPVTITTSQLSSGNVGSYYSQQLNARSGYPQYTWYISSGTLPDGLILDPSGLISGTPTSAGTFTFTVTVEDQIGGTNSKSLTIQINASSNPVITTTSLPSVLAGNPYSQTLVANGGVTPYTNWIIIIGSLPAGITLNSSNGVISGTSTAPGNYSFTVQVTDSNNGTDVQALSINVQAISPTITTTNISDGVVGSFYSSTISATGGTTPYVNWTITTGSIPQGLSITSNPSNAVISGYPTKVGNYSFTVQVTDSYGGTDSRLFNVIISDGAYPVISTLNLPNGQISAYYSTTVLASGGSLPYSWSVLDGSLPNGLLLNISTGEISGTPTANGVNVFTIKVSDANGNSDTQILSIEIGNYSLPSITTNSLPNTVVNSNYNSYIQAIGGNLPYSWTASSLPSGLSIDSVSGLITGIASATGSFNFNATVTDKIGQIDTKSFLITVGNTQNPIIITTSIRSADRGINYNQTLQVAGGTPSYSWSVTSGGLPDGISLSSRGVLSGIADSIGIYNFTALVTDSLNQSDTQNYSLTIKSTGFDSSCCICVFTNEIVEFSHNAATGILTSNGGTILSNKKWQAPSVEGIYDVSVTIEGNNGIISLKNTIKVIRRLELLNIGKNLNDLLPGDTFFIETNYPVESINWTTIDYDLPIVTPSGLVVINSSATDNCFGALECTIRCTLNETVECAISSYIDVKIKVNPVYPTPNNCGPKINKWLREVKDFRVITTDFEGGCDETHIRNKVPIVKWTVTYDGLNNYKEPYCDINVDNSLNSQFDSYQNCPPILQSSNRLDDFWNLVYGEYKTFTLIDYDTDEVWHNARFSDNMSIDHRHRRTSTSRTSKIVWKPCCNKSPAGGTCSKHGIVSYQPVYNQEVIMPLNCRLVSDIIVKINEVSYNDILLSWILSSSDLIIGYQIRINGGIYKNFTIDVGNINNYDYSNLDTNVQYIFEVRGYNGLNQYSPWSLAVSATTLFTDYQSIVIDEEQFILTDDYFTFLLR